MFQINAATPDDVTAGISLDRLRWIILEADEEFWRQGSDLQLLLIPPERMAQEAEQAQRGRVTLGAADLPSMIVLREAGLGYCLQCDEGNERDSDQHAYSLGDRGRMTEIVGDEVDWLTSAGLFVPPDVAWRGIEHFCTTGKRSPEIEWIRPGEMPDGANW